MDKLSIYVGLVIVAFSTLIGSILENIRKFELDGKPVDGHADNIKILYESLNLNLCLSLGLIGLYWEKDTSNPKVLILLFVPLLLGILAKASCNHQPERISLKDNDFRWGVIFPNACAFFSMAIIVGPNVLKVNIVWIFIPSLIIGFLLSILLSNGANHFFKPRLSYKEQSRIKSLDSIDSLLKQLKKLKKHPDFDAKIKAEMYIWSAIMDYSMQANSEYRAIHYIKAVYSSMEPKNEEWYKKSLQIIDARFSKCKTCTI